jgi:hypothetical protein
MRGCDGAVMYDAAQDAAVSAESLGPIDVASFNVG